MYVKDNMNSDDAADMTQNGDAHSVSSQGPGTPPENGRDAPSAQTRRKREMKELVDKLIQHCKERRIPTLDLNRKGLRKIPDELLELSHLECLYLEGNEIACLPENFFDCLPCLQWLDLRNNYLQSIPSAYIGRHPNLRNLLLQGNEIRSLPLELGLVTTLNGLSISNNPIEFPPPEVIERGCPTVLAFLRETLKAKSMGKFPADSNGLTFDCDVHEEIPNIEDLNLNGSDMSSDDEYGLRRGSSKHSSHSLSSKYRRGSGHNLVRTNSDDSDLVGPVLKSASLQRRASYGELKKQQLAKLKNAGALGKPHTRNNRPSGKKLTKLSQYPEPPPPERVEKAYLEEKRLARLKELKEKQEMILQRRRDQDALKEWRDDGKKKQMEKYREKYIKGKLDYDKAAEKAPFGVEKEHMKMLTNEERIAQDIREKHEKMRRLPSPGTQQRMEQQRMERDRELERRLKEHTTQMQERRRQPKGTPQQEMAAAQKELQIAEQLRAELEQRRKALEYRFTAFTGDIA